MAGNSLGLGLSCALACAMSLVAGASCAPAPSGEQSLGKEAQADTVQFGSGAQLIDNWKWWAAPVGGIAGASASYTAPVFELHGSGQGPGYYNKTFDQMEYVFTHATGDIEIIARLTVADAGTSNAGVMIRAANCPLVQGQYDCTNVIIDSSAAMGSLNFEYGLKPDACTAGSPDPLSQIWSSSRRPSSEAGQPPFWGRTFVNPSRDTLPVWLRLRRVGKDYSVWRRRDFGAPWVPMWGGELAAQNVLVGLYASGLWTTGNSVVARFDSVKVTQLVPNPPSQGRIPMDDFPGTTYLDTGAIGSKFFADSTDHISGGMHGFFVGPDGTSYKYSRETELGHNVNVVKPNGSLVKVVETQASIYGFLQGGITGDAAHIYLASSGAPTTNPTPPTWQAPFVIERHAAGTYAIEGSATVPSLAGNPGVTVRHVGGIATYNNKIYVSDFDFNKVRALDANQIPPGDAAPNTNLEVASCTLPNSGSVRPGLLAADRSGRLWVARTPSTPVSAYTPDPVAWRFQNTSTTIQCYVAPTTPNGGNCAVCSGSPSVTVNSPSALAVSWQGAAPGKLLVASNALSTSNPGQGSQNILTYNLATNPPTPGTAIGAANGVFDTDPAKAGLLYPAGTSTTGLPKLFSPIGAGIDSSGNTYVASSAPRVEIHKLLSSGTRDWSVFGVGRESGAFDPDPASNGQDYYTLTRHFVKNANGTAGSGWDVKSVTWNPFLANPDDTRSAYATTSLAAPFIRNLASGKYMFVFDTTWGLRIYKFNGEVARPYGSLHWVMGPQGWQVESWTDSTVNPNGLRDAPDTVQLRNAPGAGFVPTVDSSGRIWLSFKPTAPPSTGILGVSFPWNVGSNTVEYPAPYDYGYVTAQAVVYYDDTNGHDALYALAQMDLGVTHWNSDHTQPIDPWSSVVFRFDQWSAKAGQTAVPAYTYRAVMPDPRLSYAAGEDFGFDPEDPYCTWSEWPFLNNLGFELAGDYFFVQSRGSATIFAHRTSDGQKVAELWVGSEASGNFSWGDAPSLRGIKLANGDYQLTWYDETSPAVNHLLTWTPSTAASPASLSPTAWYAASSSDITDAGGGAVSVWSDRSGHGHDVVMTNPCCRPAYLGTGWAGGTPTIRFDGTNSVLTQDPWPTENPLGNESAFTVLAVAKANEVRDSALISWWGSGGLVSALNHASGPNLWMESRRWSPYGGDHTFDGSTNLGLTGHVLAFRYDGGGVFRLSVDGSLATSYNASPFSPVGPMYGGPGLSQVLIGWGDAWAGLKYKGDISELVLVPRNITNAEVDAYCAYASSQWHGLPTCQAAP